MEAYDEEWYVWWVTTMQDRFDQWVERMEKYYEEIENSGVPRFICL